MARYEILLTAEFSAAHRLRMPDGSIEPLHGHNWQVEVFLEGGRLDSSGLLADFTVLHKHLDSITRSLHDAYLNDLPAFNGVNPSTENVARYIHDRFAPAAPPETRVTKVRVWETRHSAAAFIPDV